jgi:hypothetical protein
MLSSDLEDISVSFLHMYVLYPVMLQFPQC